MLAYGAQHTKVDWRKQMQSLNAERLSGTLGARNKNFDPAGHAGALATM
jgi:hypothetical protein